MGVLYSQVAPREDGKATNATTRKKKKRPRVPLLGVHLNTLWGFGVQTHITLRVRTWPTGIWSPEQYNSQAWNRCEGLRLCSQLNNNYSVFNSIQEHRRYYLSK